MMEKGYALYFDGDCCTIPIQLKFDEMRILSGIGMEKKLKREWSIFSKLKLMEEMLKKVEIHNHHQNLNQQIKKKLLQVH